MRRTIVNFSIRLGKARLVVLPALLFLFAVAAQAQMGKPQYKSLPPELGDVRIDQNLNEQVPLDLEFRDEN